MAAIIAFRHTRPEQNWTNEELAELYRVVDILNRAGVPVDTDMGLSDEGDPWFAFCRKDTCDVIVHFSRIEGQFIAVSATTSDVVRGNNFRRVAEALVNRQPLILPSPAPGQKLFLHPAVILTALVATTLAQMKSWDGQELALFDEAVDGDAAFASSASFAEVLKVAFLDAMNFVIRGIAGPLDIKNGFAELGQTASHSQGLGSLSLASVVAFAISVIQGTPLPSEMDGERRLLADTESAGAAEAKKIALAQIAPAEINVTNKSGEAGSLHVAEVKEASLPKAPPPGAASTSSDAGEKTVVVEKTDAALANDESHARHTRKELAEKLQISDPGTEHIKLFATEKAAGSPADSLNVLEILAGPKVAVSVAEANNVREYHHFSFSEISKEAIEFFFVKLESGDTRDSGSREIVISTSLEVLERGDNLLAAPGQRVSLNASDIVFAGGDPVAMSRLNLITDFVNSSSAQLQPFGSFANALGPYWSGDKALTIVVFDSQDIPLNIFSFASDVLFVEESQLAGLNVNFNRSLQVDLANGGDVTLLGVINLAPFTHTA